MSPSGLAELVSQGRWIPAKHLEYLAQKLILVAGGHIKRLLVEMPPRHGKSELTSKYFPAWYLGNFPDKRIIITSYEADFASSWGRKSRDILEEWGEELFGVKIRSDSSASNRWDIVEHEGGVNTAGVGGPITGKGAHVLIVDDPVKNSEEANSKTMRDKIWEWWRSTAYTRLEPNGSAIIIMTRWHEDDLIGRILAEMKQGGEPWEEICLPALAEENDPIGRLPGEALFPERYNAEAIKKIERNIGSYWFSALYKGRPSPAEGKLFKRSYFRYFTIEYQGTVKYYLLHTDTDTKRIEADKCSIFQTCDPAATEKEQSDYFVLSTWAVTPEKDLLLLDIFREKAETTKHEFIMKSQFELWHPTFQGVENKTFGLNIIQGFKKFLPIKAIKSDVDKVSRARTIQARYELGTVYHRLNAPWLTAFEDELLEFPNGAHDDQVDTASFAGIEIFGINTPTIWRLK
jgi:predicted phage terminase large subunit-like protein